VERLLTVGAALCRRLEADLEVLADPARPDWEDLQLRLGELGRREALACHLTPIAGLDARRVVAHAHQHECVVTVVVGRPGAWAVDDADPWARLACPLVAAADHPSLPPES
jgi:hypothetical protein